MTEQEFSVYVSLGSNSPDSAERLAQARALLVRLPAVRLVAASSLYSTEPQGYTDQPWFLNQVVRLGLGLRWRPQDFVHSLLALEQTMGRVRSADPALRYGPRVIDLDLLLFGQEHCQDAACTVPHPRMTQRAFVLVPLVELEATLPVAGKTAQAWLNALPHRVEQGTADSPHIRRIFQ